MLDKGAAAPLAIEHLASLIGWLGKGGLRRERLSHVGGSVQEDARCGLRYHDERQRVHTAAQR